MATQPFQPTELVDFMFSFSKGVNMGKSPLLLPKNQLAYLENGSVRGDFASARPAYWNRPLNYNATTQFTSNLTALQVQTNFTTGQFQGWCFYSTDTGGSGLVAAISGRIYQIAVTGFSASISDVTPATSLGAADTNNTTTPQQWLWQSERWVICNDGSSYPIFFDVTAGTSRRSHGISGLLGTVQTAATVPGLGASVVVTLTSAFTGTLGDLVSVFTPGNLTAPPGPNVLIGYFRIGPYNASSDTNNAQLTNTDNTTQTIAPGTPVQITVQTGTTLTKYAAETPSSGAAQVTARPFGSGPGQFGVTVNGINYQPDPGPLWGVFTTATFPGNVGDTAGFVVNNPNNFTVSGVPPGTWIALMTVLQKDQSITANDGTGTINPNPNNIFGRVTSVQAPGNFRVGDVLYYAPTFGPKNIAYFASQNTSNGSITINGNAANDPVILTQAYSGANGLAVTINGIHYTISSYTPSPAGNQYTLTLVSAPSTTATGSAIPANSYLQSLAEMPPGRMGAYILARNWVALADGRSYWASDLCGDSSGNQAFNFRDAVLKSTENNTINGGGAFTIPGSPADIRSIVAAAQLDTSLGQGSVMVGTPYTVFSNNAPLDRTTWANLQTPIQTISLISNGPLAHYSTVAANGDTLYRAIDGIRSLIIARRDFDVWGNVPQSFEVSPVLAADNAGLLQYGYAIVFDNRLLMTATPTASTQGTYHTRLIALNFDPMSSLGGKDPACYDGIWTGLNILSLAKGTFQGAERAFALNLNLTTNNIELWEIVTSDQANLDNGTTNIVMIMESPNLDFGETDPRMRSFKTLTDGEIQIDQLIGTATFQAFYKPDQYPTWIPWITFSVSADPKNSPSFQSRLGLGQPSARAFDPYDNRPLPDGYNFQARFIVTGQVEVLSARFKAVTKPQPRFAPIPSGAVPGE